ncbi:MAG: 2-dehydropantoate 2-reductase [Solirubrobacteraceae bacterium]
MSSEIAILGAGGVGGLIAAALARAGADPIVIAREPTAALIARDGIAVRSVALGTFVARPRSTPVLEHPVAFLLVATKATSLADALQRVRTHPELVVPLLNGVDHMGALRERFGAARVAAGVIRIESDRPAAGQIVQTSPQLRIDLATDEPALAQRLQDLAAILTRAQLPVRAGASEAAILWSKLVRLNALACTTSAADRPLGAIRSDPQWRATLTACVLETAAVARAEGAPLDPADTLAELEAAHPQLGSSMRRDLAAGREPELDAIAGAVLRAAARDRLACPTVARLHAQIARRAGLSTAY